jgi:predicted transcriptional regulator YdeE
MHVHDHVHVHVGVNVPGYPEPEPEPGLGVTGQVYVHGDVNVNVHDLAWPHGRIHGVLTPGTGTGRDTVRTIRLTHGASDQRLRVPPPWRDPARMNNTTQELEGFSVIGIGVRTTNQDEAAGSGRIGALWRRFHMERVAERVPERLDDDEVLAVYSGYESDETGAYDLVVGMRVPAGATAPEGLVRVDVPAATYAEFATRRGPMPDVLVETWARIWPMRARRRFTADFERHARQADPSASAVQVFVAVNAD